MTDEDRAREALYERTYQRHKGAFDAARYTKEAALAEIRLEIRLFADDLARELPEGANFAQRLAWIVDRMEIRPPKKRKTTRLEVADALIVAEIETVRAENARVLADMNHPGSDIYMANLQGREGGLLTALSLVARAAQRRGGDR